MIMNFRDEDRLWGPQLHSRLLQSHTIVGFWGKKSDDVRVQPGQPSFLFVMGTGGNSFDAAVHMLGSARLGVSFLVNNRASTCSLRRPGIDGGAHGPSVC